MKVFTEHQRFDQWWLRLLMFSTLFITVGAIILEFPNVTPDEKTLFFSLGGFSVLLVGGLTALFFILKLETKIDETGISYGFRPFQKKLKKASWNEIERCYVRNYKPLNEYGGWGYKRGFVKHGKAYNVKGNIGLQIVFKNQKKTLLGTQKPEEVKRVLKTYSYKLSNHEN